MYFCTGQGSPDSEIVDDGGIHRSVTLCIHGAHKSLHVQGGPEIHQVSQLHNCIKY